MTAMNRRQEEISAQGLSGRLLRDERMSRRTSWRVGGPARWFYVPADVDDLGEFLARVPHGMPIEWCGLGSNLLVRDGGFDGVVICTTKGLDELYRSDETGIYAEAGVPGAKVAKYAIKNALCGAEFLAGIPGTVGGALAMNAGCFDCETWDIVSFADTINRNGRSRRRDESEFSRGYRFVQRMSDEWYTGARFQLKPCDPERGRANMKSLMKHRAQTQPIQTANAGSVFRNPPDDYAARLIETAELKNHAVGDARISQKHANFIENRGNATASDIEMLINHAIARVREVHGVELHPEVRIIGADAGNARRVEVRDGERY